MLQPESIERRDAALRGWSKHALRSSNPVVEPPSHEEALVLAILQLTQILDQHLDDISNHLNTIAYAADAQVNGA